MTIYCLDDDPLELMLWAENIKRTHPEYFCQVFSKPEAFKKAVELFPPTAAIVDFVMPFTSGAEICKWLIEFYPQVKVFVNTSLEGDEYVILAERCSATYLSKTMNFKERLEVVNNGCKS